jgi:hypothetical protein
LLGVGLLVFVDEEHQQLGLWGSDHRNYGIVAVALVEP